MDIRYFTKSKVKDRCQVEVSFTSVEPPGKTENSSGRFCETCNKPLEWTPGRGRPPRFCPEHKQTSTRNNTGATTTPNKEKNKGKKRKASEDDWQKFLTMGLITGTYLVGRFAAGGQGLFLNPPSGMTDDELDDLSMNLSMEGDEAKPIAVLLAKKLTPSELNKRAGYLIVNFLELEEVGAALFGYGRRIAPVLGQRLAKNGLATQTAREQTAGRTIHLRKQESDNNGQASGPYIPSNADIVRAANERNRRAFGASAPDNGDAASPA